MATLNEMFVKLGLDAGQFSTGLNRASGDLGGFGGKIDTIVDKILSPAGIVAGLAAIGAVSFQTAKMFDASFDTIRIGTGATGEALVGLQDSFTTVFKNVPSDAATVATAIADLNTRLGLTGPELESMSTQMLNLARITKTEVGPVIASTTRVFGDWSIATGDQSGALDFLFKTSQATGIEVGRLSNIVVQFGAPLRQLGFDFEASAALMGKFEQEGVNIETVLSGMKIGLANMASAGIDGAAGMQAAIEAIKGAGSQAEANVLAIDIFGKRAGPDMAAAVREGRFELDELIGTLQASKETINDAAIATDDFGERWATTWHKVQAALLPVGNAILGFVEFAIAGLEKLVDWFTPVFEFLVGGLQKIFEWLGKVPGASKVFGDLGKDTEDLTKSLKDLSKNTTTVTKDQKDHIKDALDPLLKKTLKLTDEQKELNKEYKKYEDYLKDAKRETGLHQTAIFKLQLEVVKAREEVAIFGHGLMMVGKETVNYIAEAFNLSDALHDVKAAAFDVTKAMPEMSNEIQKAIGLSVSNVDKLGEAFKTLNVKTSTELNKTAADAQAAYEIIRKSGVATANEILQAELAALKARVEAQRVAGVEVTKEDERRLKKLEDILDEHVETQKGTWGDLAKEVSTIFDDLGKGLSKAFLGIFGIGVDNSALKKEERDLKDSLAERTKEWNDYQSNYTSTLETIRTEAAKELADGLADLKTNLDDKQAEYDSYVEDTVAKLAEIREANREGLAQELADLQAGLDERGKEYEEYEYGIQLQIEEAREKYRETLEDRQRELQEALSDELREYEDYVEDVNLRLSRLGEDYAESVDDETRDTNRGIEDKKKLYERDRRSIEKKIAKELKKGSKANQEQIDDWRETLEEKGEDLEEYIREANEDLEEFKSDQQRRMDREEADLKTSLARRSEDWAEFQDDKQREYDEAIKDASIALAKEEGSLKESLANRKGDYDAYVVDTKTKIAELPAAYALALAKEEKDLQASLIQKKADLDQYKTDITQKAEDLRIAIGAKLTAQETDLETSLANQKADYDQFVLDVEAKLDELHGENSVWAKIKKAGVEALESIADALGRILIKELLIDPLAKILKDGLFDLLGDAAGGFFKKIGDWLGGGTKTPTPTPDGGGGGGGDGGGGGGGGGIDYGSWFGAFYDIGKDLTAGTVQSYLKTTNILLMNLVRILEPGATWEKISQNIAGESHPIQETAANTFQIASWTQVNPVIGQQLSNIWDQLVEIKTWFKDTFSPKVDDIKTALNSIEAVTRATWMGAFPEEYGAMGGFPGPNKPAISLVNVEDYLNRIGGLIVNSVIPALDSLKNYAASMRDLIRDSVVPPLDTMAMAGGPTVNVYVTLDGKELTATVATEIVDTLRSGGQQL